MLYCAGVCLEEKDLAGGMFVVKNVDEATCILLPQTPRKLKELLCLTFVKPTRIMPTCIIDNFINVSDYCGSEYIYIYIIFFLVYSFGFCLFVKLGKSSLPFRFRTIFLIRIAELIMFQEQ